MSTKRQRTGSSEPESPAGPSEQAAPPEHPTPADVVPLCGNCGVKPVRVRDGENPPLELCNPCFVHNPGLVKRLRKEATGG